jgi:flagellar basal-body rod modification protein FlgD
VTTIQATGAIPGDAQSAAAAIPASTASDTADRFLTLLVTQLKNQDPLNPLDNAQLTSQLAQISTVSGINRLNDTMAALAASVGAAQSLQSASLVDRDVVAAGDKLLLADSKGPLGFELADAADSVSVTIRDASGRPVRRMELGAQPQGLQTLVWDGATDAGVAAAAGTYSFTITATSGGKAVTADPMMVARVDGFVPGAKDAPAQLQLGRLGRIDLTQVREIK